MATIADLLVKISADTSKFRKELEASQRQIKRALGSEAIGLSNKFRTGLLGLGAAVGALGVASIKLAGDMKVTEKSFEVMLGSAEDAKKIMADLTKFAATTPFSLGDLSDASKQLKAFGFDVKDLMPILNAAGNAAALMGKGSQGISQISLALGQMYSKGQLAGQEMLQLANAGINAYKYVAEAMGITEREARDKISKGQIGVAEGLNAIVNGMQKDFKGGMQALSEEIPGMLSTIKDNATLALAAIGGRLTETFDIKGKLKGAMEWMQKFTESLNKGGLAAAFLENTSGSAQIGLVLLAGAVSGIVVPAFVLAGGTIWLALAPLLPFIALGTAIAGLGLLIYHKWQVLKDFFSSFRGVLGPLFTPLVMGAQNAVKAAKYVYNNWETLKGYFVFFFDSLKNGFASFGVVIEVFAAEVQKNALKARAFLLNIFDSEAAAQVKASITEVEDRIAGLHLRAAELVGEKEQINRTLEDIKSGAYAAAKEAERLKNEIIGIALSIGEAARINVATGGLNLISKDGAGSQTAAGGSGVDKAKQLSEAIEREWVNATKSELEQLDIWRDENLAALAALGASYAGYERDKERLMATYNVRRNKLVREETQAALNQIKQLNDSWRGITNDITKGGLTGAALFEFEQQLSFDTNLDKLKSDFDDLTQRFEVATDREKEIYRNWLKEKGLMFAENEQGQLDLSAEYAAQRAALEQNLLAQKERDYRANKDILAEIDAAKYEGDMARLVEYLSAENALRLTQIEAQQSMMDTWLEAQKAAWADHMTLIADLYGEFYSGFSSNLSDVLSGTKSVQEAMEDLGKSMLKVVTDFVAKKIAGMLMANAMAMILGKQQTATSVGEAAVVAAAWSKAAAMVSLASFGANAGPAMAGILSTTTFAMSLAQIPGLAEGGIVTGPTTALIGEGRYAEAVLPLNEKYFEKIGLTGGKDGNTYVTQNNYGDINTDVDLDDMYAALAATMRKGARR